MSYQTPSYHLTSPLSRSRSTERRGSTSSLGGGGSGAMYRSSSFGGSSASHSHFTRPSYGYGGGYMSRSLSRSTSLSRSNSLFGRTLRDSALHSVAPFHSTGVQLSTPHYSDKYPHVRYSYANKETGLAILAQSEAVGPRHYGIRDVGTQRWLEGKLNAYNTGLFTRPDYSRTVERPVAPQRNYVRYMPVEDATDLFKKKMMTVGSLSKYWLSPSTWASRRQKDVSYKEYPSKSTYDYSSRYQSRPLSHLSYGAKLTYS